jgi:hypothetical protein
MLKDRPAIAQYGDKAEVLYRWAALEFAGKSSGERFQWDPALPELPFANKVAPMEDTGGVIQVRSTFPDGENAGKELGFEESWLYLVSCFHNVATVRDYRRLTIEATEGGLTKKEYIEQACRRECDEIERNRAFYADSFLPWAKEHRVPTNPWLWILDREFVGKRLLVVQLLSDEEYDLFALSGMFQRGEIEKAIDFAEGYLARAGTETTRRLIPLIQGYCSLKNHQPEAAVAAFDKVGDVYPQCMDAYLGRAAAYGVVGDAKKTADNIAAARAIRATHANMPLHSPPIDKGLDGNRELAKKLDLDERLYPLRDEILHEIGRIQLWSGYAVSTDSFSRPAE